MKRISTECVNRKTRAMERYYHGQYSERANYRLRIAATLLHRRDLNIDVLGISFYPAVLQAIDDLGEQRRAWLRGLVDWVEAYDHEDSMRSECMKSGCCSRPLPVSVARPRDDVRHAERFLPVMRRLDP